MVWSKLVSNINPGFQADIGGINSILFNIESIDNIIITIEVVNSGGSEILPEGKPDAIS